MVYYYPRCIDNQHSLPCEATPPKFATRSAIIQAISHHESAYRAAQPKAPARATLAELLPAPATRQGLRHSRSLSSIEQQATGVGQLESR